MKKLILLLFLTGCSTFKVGDCVRELGYSAIQKVTVISEFVETAELKDGYLRIFNTKSINTLLKIECPK